MKINNKFNFKDFHNFKLNAFILLLLLNVYFLIFLIIQFSFYFNWCSLLFLITDWGFYFYIFLIIILIAFIYLLFRLNNSILLLSIYILLGFIFSVITWTFFEKSTSKVESVIKLLYTPAVKVEVGLDTNIINIESLPSFLVKLYLNKDYNYIKSQNIISDKFDDFKFAIEPNDRLNSLEDKYPIKIINIEYIIKNNDTIILQQIETGNEKFGLFKHLLFQNNIISDSINIKSFIEGAVFTPQTLALYLRAITYLYENNYPAAILCYSRIIDNIRKNRDKTNYQLNNRKTEAYILFEKVRTIDYYIELGKITPLAKESFKQEVTAGIDNIIKLTRINDTDTTIFGDQYCTYLLYSLYIYNKYIDWNELNTMRVNNNPSIKSAYEITLLNKLYKTYSEFNKLINSNENCRGSLSFTVSSEEFKFIENNLIEYKHYIEEN
jgi:hypothetical protein